MSHPTLSPADLLKDLNWRYATKAFDPTKTTPAETWKALEESLVLTPSSCGLQPWKFIVITDKDLKAKLKPHAWNQSQVTDCSHFVVFAGKTSIDEAYIDQFLARMIEMRGGSIDALKGYRGMMTGLLLEGPVSKAIPEWSARQTYIALGQFMAATAMLGVDACPMEGFVPAEFDKILGLPAKGFASVVCAAAGYRSGDDKYATLPKVRFNSDEMLERI